MTDHFDKWINAMGEDEYGEMFDEDNPYGFTEAQEEKAMNIRTPPTKQDIEDLDKLQAGYDATIDVPSHVSSATPITVEPLQPEPMIEQEPETFDVSESLPSEPVTEGVPEFSQEFRQPVRPQRAPRVKAPVPSRETTRAFTSAVRSVGRFVRRFFGGGE